MSLKFLISLFSLVITSEIIAQNYIGLHKDEVIDSMKVNFKEFKLNKDVVNKTYKYLKFEDQISDQTMLFFLSEDDKCTLVRWMSDYSNINDVIKKLDKNYRKSDKNKWLSTKENKGYDVILEEGEWYFTVTFKQK